MSAPTFILKSWSSDTDSKPTNICNMYILYVPEEDNNLF